MAKNLQQDGSVIFSTAANANEMEEFFDNEVQTIRRHFPPSFHFTDIKAKGQFRCVCFQHYLYFLVYV